MSQKESIHADYIIAGAGCAGLSLAVALKRSTLPFTKVLIIDQDLKQSNDRTWCFWNKGQENWYDEIIHQRWTSFEFSGTEFNQQLNIAPYSYFLIKGIDFYKYCFQELKEDPRFVFVHDQIASLASDKNKGILTTSKLTISADVIFNSALRTVNIKKKDINYLQHFKGWVIETDAPIFKQKNPVFMDFNTGQTSGCFFFYVIPFSDQTALIEYTGFSKEPLKDTEYDLALEGYISKMLDKTDYRILEMESGQIPMYDSAFVNPFGKRVVNIGSSGGSSKQSTGYTFYFIQKHIKKIIQDLSAKKTPGSLERQIRFKLYDKIFMKVLDNEEISAEAVFARLMKGNEVKDVLAFLNEESNFIQELKILNSVQKLPFLKATFQKFLSL